MNRLDLKNAWAQWSKQQNYDLHLTLRAQTDEIAFESLEKKIGSLFYKAECVLFTRRRRQNHALECRIERLVGIESSALAGKERELHAHVFIVTPKGITQADLINVFTKCWQEVTHTSHGYYFNAKKILDANIHGYNAKSILTTGHDGISLRTSFIRKRC